MIVETTPAPTRRANVAGIDTDDDGGGGGDDSFATVNKEIVTIAIGGLVACAVLAAVLLFGIGLAKRRRRGSSAENEHGAGDNPISVDGTGV